MANFILEPFGFIFKENVMKKVVIMLSILGLISASPILGETTATQTQVVHQEIRPIVVRVNGLVCGFCAQGIKKRLLSLPAIQSVQVNLGEKRVSITLKPKTVLTDADIKTTIQQAGYAVVRIER